MVDSTRPPDEDRLIERLAALGPVLDGLYEEAATGDAPTPAPRDPGLRHRPRHRSSQPRRRALAAAAIVLVIAAGAAIIATGRSKETVQTDTTTTTAAPATDAQLQALVANRLDAMESCGPVPTEADWPRPWPDGWKLVGSSDCDLGWLQVGVEAVQPVPVYADAKVGEPKAYWSTSTGWITLDEYRDPDFDVAAYRAAYQAALKERGQSEGN
jgi:hypothetical protein